MTDLWPHQSEAVERLLRDRYFYAGYDMGTGKTRVGVEAVNRLAPRLTLIVCPKAVQPVWPAQFALYGNGQRCVVLEGSGREKHAQAKALIDSLDPIAIVVNYDAVWRKPLGELLINTPWGLVICDEAHRIKAPGGVASRFMGRLSKLAKYRLCLSGTPMPHSPLDIYAQYRMLDPSVFGWTMAGFRARYCVMHPKFPKVLKWINEAELKSKIASRMLVVKKRDVLDLPPTLDETIQVELSPAEMRVYRSLAKDFVADVESGQVTAGNALTRLIRLQQVCSGFTRADEQEREETLGSSKFDALRDWLEDLPEQEPLVVFCRFRRDLDAVHEAAKERGSLELSGRRNELAEWQAGAKPVLAVQIQAGGLGVDLTRSAYAVYYSLGFSLGDYEQSRARLDRPGQTRSVTYVHLVATGTVDEQIVKALGEKRDVVNSILEAVNGYRQDQEMALSQAGKGDEGTGDQIPW
jgi:SNF2 family DNA or RNA helicase